MGTVVVPRVMSRGTVVAWPRWASCCGRVCCVAAVGVVALHCLAGAVIAWPRWASCRVAAVGVVSRGRGGCRVALPWWVSSRCVLCRGRCRCVAAVGVVAPCCVAVGVVALRGRGGCHRAAWDRGDWTAKVEISRKKRKGKKKNAPEGTPARVARRCSSRVSH
jgi:hypothetical protein